MPNSKKISFLAPLRRSLAQKNGVRRYIGPKRFFALAFLAAVVASGWYLRKYGILDPSVVFRLLEAYPVAGPVFFIVLYGVAVLTALPTIPFNLAAGFFWGPIMGGTLAATGTTLGSLITFLMTRSLFGRPLAGHFDNKLVSEIQNEFKVKGWKLVAFMRLNPVFPTGPLNYILGLTSISTLTYTWVTFVFLLPASILVAYIGNRMGTFIMTGDGASDLKILLSVSAAGTLIVGFIYGVRLFNRLRRTS